MSQTADTFVFGDDTERHGVGLLSPFFRVFRSKGAATTEDPRLGTVVAPLVSAAEAHGLAADFLIDHVGELVEPGTPRLDSEGGWIVPIYLSVCPRGRLGEVGAVVVDATTGAVLFSDQDRQEMRARARALIGTTPP